MLGWSACWLPTGPIFQSNFKEKRKNRSNSLVSNVVMPSGTYQIGKMFQSN